jgi:hypothetical protein
LPTQLAFVQITIDQNGCHNSKSYNVDVDENKFQGFHTTCELNVILYGLSLLLKTMGFYKVHIMNWNKMYFIVILCIHVQNSDI